MLFPGGPVLGRVGHPVREPAPAGLHGRVLPARHVALPARTRHRRTQGIHTNTSLPTDTKSSTPRRSVCEACENPKKKLLDGTNLHNGPTRVLVREKEYTPTN